MTDAERRAAEAKSLLDNSLLTEAFEVIEKGAYEELLAVRPWLVDGEAQRSTLINRINAIRELRAHLQSVVTQGTQSSRKAPTVA